MLNVNLDLALIQLFSLSALSFFVVLPAYMLLSIYQKKIKMQKVYFQNYIQNKHFSLSAT